MLQILDYFKMKGFTEDNIKFDQNGRKFSKQVENTVEKREILDSSELKKCAEDIFKFDKGGRKFSNGVETLLEKDKLLITSNFSFSFLNPFPNKPWFLRVCNTSLLKTLREKEKLLVTSNFCFSLRVFYLFEELSANFIKFEIVVCKIFLYGRV